MNTTGVCSVVVVALSLLGAAAPAQAAEPSKRYANCTALLKAYPAGVAKSPTAANRAVRDGMRRPKVSASTYNDNSTSDRDKDGVACEQSS